MTEFKTNNGAKVVINSGDWQDAVALKNTVAEAIIKKDVSFDLASLKGDKEINTAALLKLFMSVDSSKEVYDALFKCLIRCTYNGHKITEETFDEISARENYYEIAIACLKENLTPFFKSLISQLSGLNLVAQSGIQK